MNVLEQSTSSDLINTIVEHRQLGKKGQGKELNYEIVLLIHSEDSHCLTELQNISFPAWFYQKIRNAQETSATGVHQDVTATLKATHFIGVIIFWELKASSKEYFQKEGAPLSPQMRTKIHAGCMRRFRNTGYCLVDPKVSSHWRNHQSGDRKWKKSEIESYFWDSFVNLCISCWK